MHLSNLGLDLYGLTVYGSGPGVNVPLLQVDHVGLGVRVISVLHRQWNLDNVSVDHPVVNLIVDQKGENNLPRPKTGGNSTTNIFDLAIRHILLDRGEVYYNDRKSALGCQSARSAISVELRCKSQGPVFREHLVSRRVLAVRELRAHAAQPGAHNSISGATGSTLNNVVLKVGAVATAALCFAGKLQQPHGSCPVHDDAGHGTVSPGPEESVAAWRSNSGERHGRLLFRSRTATARHYFGGRNHQEFCAAATYSIAEHRYPRSRLHAIV